MLARSPKWIAIVAAAGGVATAGCGSTNPPCPTDLAEVEAARKEAQSAEQRVAELNSRKEQLESQIAAEDARRAELERRKAELQGGGQ
jgi:hypothetical protein